MQCTEENVRDWDIACLHDDDTGRTRVFAIKINGRWVFVNDTVTIFLPRIGLMEGVVASIRRPQPLPQKPTKLDYLRDTTINSVLEVRFRGESAATPIHPANIINPHNK